MVEVRSRGEGEGFLEDRVDLFDELTKLVKER